MLLPSVPWACRAAIDRCGKRRRPARLMETRRSKRKQQETEQQPVQRSQAPSAAKRGRGAPKEETRSTRSARQPASGQIAGVARPRSGRGGRSAQPAPAQAPETAFAPPDAQPASEQGPMDRSGRRSSRGEPSDGPPHGSGEEVRAQRSRTRPRRRRGFACMRAPHLAHLQKRAWLALHGHASCDDFVAPQQPDACLGGGFCCSRHGCAAGPW